MGTVVLGTGSCLPRRVVTNAEMETIVDTNDEWIRTRTGIEARHYGGKGELNYQLSTEAANRALDAAGIKSEELGLVVVGTVSSHMLMPSTACFVQTEIGAKNAFVYDLNAACSGFIYGLDLADKYIKADPDLKVLVIGSETLSARTDFTDRNTCILFGDGAGAAVFGSSDDKRGIMATDMHADGSLWELLHMHAPKSSNPDLQVEGATAPLIRMQGKEVFKYAVKAMANSINTVLQKEELTIADIDLLIPHQANMRILNNLTKRLAIPSEKVFINLPQYGNTSAASVPIAIDEARRAGKITKGDKVLLCSFGGGFTWGAVLLTW